MNLINAFIAGTQFAQRAGLLAQDAKAKKDEEIHWRTIGEGEEAHAVPIDGPEPNTKKAESKKAESKKAENKKAEAKKAEAKKAETKKAESKKAENKKAESKKAENKKAESKKAEAKKAEAGEENVEKAHQLSAYVDQKFRQIAQPGIGSVEDTNRGLKSASVNIPGAPLSTYDAVKGPVRQIIKNLSAIDKTMSNAKDQIKAAARDGKIEKDRVDAELTQYRKYCSKFKDYLDYANDQKYNLFMRANDGHRGVIKNLNNLAELTSKLSKNVADWREGLPAQPRAEGNRGTETSRASRKETALEKRIKDAISKKIPGTDKDTESNIKAALEKIGKHIPLFNESMDKIKEQIAAKEKNGTFDITEANAELRKRREYIDAFADYLTQANDTINNLDKTTNDEHQKDRGSLMNLALYTAKLTRDALIWRDDVHSVSTDLNDVRVYF